MAGLGPRRQPGTDRTEQSVRQFLAAVHGYLGRAMPQHRVGEAVHQVVFVSSQVEIQRDVQRRRDVDVHEGAGIAGKLGGAHRLSDELETGQRTEVGQSRVAAVQQPQLHFLIRGHVAHEGCPRPLPCRPRPGKGVLDDPLGKRLGHHHGLVLEAQQVQGEVAVLRGGGRHDTVHHRAREGNVLSHPGTQPLSLRRIEEIAEIGHQLAQSGPVVREVVAAQHGQRRAGPLAPSLEAPHQLADHCAGRAPCGIGLQFGVVTAQPASGGVEPVALLCNGKGHDTGSGGAHPLDQFLCLLAGKYGLADGADHADRSAFLGPGHDAVEAVLGQERLGYGRAALGDATDAPGTVRTCGQCILGVYGLMGAVESPETQVDDANGELPRVGDRPPLLGDSSEVSEGKPQRVYRSPVGRVLGGPGSRLVGTAGAGQRFEAITTYMALLG